MTLLSAGVKAQIEEERDIMHARFRLCPSETQLSVPTHLDLD